MGLPPPLFSEAGVDCRLCQGDKEAAPPTPENPHFVQAGASPLTIHQAVVEVPPAPPYADPPGATSCTRTLGPLG